MKKFILSLIILLPLFSSAQNCNQTMTITAKDSLVWIVGGTIDQADIKIALTQAELSNYDTVNHRITVTLTECQIAAICITMGGRPEGLYATCNAELKALILPLLPSHASLYNWFLTYLSNNNQQLNQVLIGGKKSSLSNRANILRNQ